MYLQAVEGFLKMLAVVTSHFYRFISLSKNEKGYSFPVSPQNFELTFFQRNLEIFLN